MLSIVCTLASEVTDAALVPRPVMLYWFAAKLAMPSRNHMNESELSNGARVGLTGAVAVLARKTARSNVTINRILPGPFATDRLIAVNQKTADTRGVPVATIDAERKAAIPAGRYGTPAEFGAVVAFLCSQHAGFITGQNILIDGGGFPGLL